MKYEAVIFDLDGTIIDSMGVWEKIDKEFLGKRGLVATKEYSEAIKAKSFYDTAKYTIEQFSLEETIEELVDEWHKMALNEYSYNIKLKPNAKEYIANLKEKNVKIALATSCSKYLFEPALKNNGIYDYFDLMCTTDEVSAGKETPDLFLYVAEQLGVSSEKCLVFEDILVAIKSAKTAGLNVYGVYDQFSEAQWKEIETIADGVIYDFAEAPMME